MRSTFTWEFGRPTLVNARWMVATLLLTVACFAAAQTGSAPREAASRLTGPGATPSVIGGGTPGDAPFLSSELPNTCKLFKDPLGFIRNKPPGVVKKRFELAESAITPTGVSRKFRITLYPEPSMLTE